MKTDYYFKNFIITTYTDHEGKVYQIDGYVKGEKKLHRTTNEKLIQKILEVI